MTTTGLVFMICTMLIVISFTGYFFWKVLTSPPKPEPDSYTDNDEPGR